MHGRQLRLVRRFMYRYSIMHGRQLRLMRRFKYRYVYVNHRRRPGRLLSQNGRNPGGEARAYIYIYLQE